MALLALGDLTDAEAALVCGMSQEAFHDLLDDPVLCERAAAEASRLVNGSDLSEHRARRILAQSVKVLSARITRSAAEMPVGDILKTADLLERLVGVIQRRTVLRALPGDLTADLAAGEGDA